MMAFCSRMYVPPSDAKAAAVDDMSSNNNIVLISYSILKQNKIFHEEAPFFCRGCSSALCHYSKLLSRDEYYKKMTEEEFPEEMDDIKKAELENKDKNGNFLKGKFIKDLQEGERGWICEFCDVHNRVPQNVTVPKTEDELYLLKKRNTIVQTTQFEETKTATTDGYHPEDETSMIFCIDVSGSMNVLHKVNNDGRTENSSRLKLVTDAVLKQMQTMSETHPNIKVGIIPFSSAVTIKGDGKENQVVVSTDLDNMGKLFSYSKMRGKALLTQSITESYDRLSVLIKRLQASGGTALGPALLCGLGLAVQDKPGSKIILCTDGLANVGLGSLENENEAVLKESQAFYDKVADIAAESGVSISIITIQGNACRVDALGPLTDKTAGTITRVDPANFDLSSIAANNLIATNVQLKAIIHEALTFQNEDVHSLHNNKSILIKNVGSVTQSNEAYFEYKVKNVQELKDNNMNLEALEWIPLQSQITYKDLRGNEFMRVICKKQELTRDEGEAQKDVKAEVLAGFVEKESANLVLQGKVKEAQNKNKAWSKRMEMVANDKGLNEQNKRVVEKFKAENEQMQLMIHESEAMQKPGSDQVQKDEINSKWYAIKQKKK